MSSSALIIGSTGLVGNEILKTLSTSDAYSTLHTISRRTPKQSSPKLNAVVEPDTTAWAAKLKAIAPAPATVMSGLGTTRAQAGGIANQWKIDHDLNVELARAAKEAGAETFVFISSAGIRSWPASASPYCKMKIGVEDSITELGFKNAVFVRPGLIMGEREVAHTGGPLLNMLARGLGSISQGIQDTLGQESDVIAKAAIHAAKLAEAGKAPSNPWILEGKDIIRLGRTEWKD